MVSESGLSEDSAVDFGLLGPLEVVIGGRPVSIDAPKVRVLLASLLVEANKSVSIERLAEQMWGERLPSAVRKTIQVYVVRLRRLLGDDPSRPALIQTTPNGYLVSIAPQRLDLGRFRAAVADAADANDLVAESELLSTALNQWRDDALCDVLSESLHREVVSRLAEERLRAAERWVQIQLELGRHREIISDLVRLTNDHPWQESLWAQLILALFRSNRRSDALDTYRNVHRMMRAELGVEPGERLQQLHRMILTEDQIETPERRAPKPERFIAVCQLPVGVRGFVGRTESVELLTELLGAEQADDSDMPIVVISGAPGVGKTALALHVAHRFRGHFPDGQLYANLQGFAGRPLAPGTILGRFLEALGVPRESMPGDQEGQAALYRSLLAGRRMLVVLDNARYPDQVRALLPGVAGCAAVITSRNDLRGLDASHGVDHLALGVLSRDESRAVLAERLGDDRAGAEPAAIDELAATCAHLPLALRIAAANLAADPHRAIGDYVAEIQRPERLNRLSVDGDEQSAVRIAFDQSYLCLAPDDRRLFRLLGLSPGADCTVQVAAALLDWPVAAAQATINRLTSASLLSQPAAGRYQFHDLIREYAAGRATEEDPPEEITAALTRVLDFYLRSATAATQRLYAKGPEDAEPDGDRAALLWLNHERQNLLAVITHGVGSETFSRHAWQLVAALRAYLQAGGDTSEVVAGCSVALTAAERAGNTAAQISALDLLGAISFNQSDYPRTIALQRQVLRLARQAGDLGAESSALLALARAYLQHGGPRPALRHARQALTASMLAGNRETETRARNVIGAALCFLGRAREAVPWQQQALELATAAGNRQLTFQAHNGLGIAYWSLGRFDDAVTEQALVLAYCEEVGHGVGQVAATNCLAEANRDAGRLELALEQASSSLAQCVRLGDRRCEATAMCIIGTTRQRMGEHRQALTIVSRSVELSRKIGFIYGEAAGLIGLAEAHRGLGDLKAALAVCELAVTKVRRGGLGLLEVNALSELAGIQLDLGNPGVARLHLGHAVDVATKRDNRLGEPKAIRLLSRLPLGVASAHSSRLGL
jgi:DNA-binding SARP family transcriptional activator/tetratricopeptide (TPR) repeat protein